MILANDFKLQWATLKDEMTAAFVECGESGWYILGQEVRAFEAELADVWGLKHAVGVASGLDAIEIGLRALDCRSGDKVLTTPVSAFATTLAILRIGAIPVFVDCEPDGLIDLEKCRRALEAHPDIRFFVPVHLYGHCLELPVLRALRDDFNLRMVEDCAQSILATCSGEGAGTVGQAAATSFYPTKNLGALGDGGALLTGSADCDRTARVLRDYGQSSKYRHELLGLNSRLDEVQAALMRRVFLPKLQSWTARRREIAARYLQGIENKRIRLTRSELVCGSVWHLFPAFVDPAERAGFLQHLQSRGIMPAEHYPTAIPDQPAMTSAKFEVVSGGYDTAQKLCRSEVSLPIHPFLTDTETATVIEACNDWKR